MEEGHVVDAERLGDRGIVLVARASDRIEALAARLEPARDAVHLAADDLAVEGLDLDLGGQADIRGLEVADPARQIAAAKLRDELFVNGLGGVHWPHLMPRPKRVEASACSIGCLPLFRHPRESGGPDWIPAFAGMTEKVLTARLHTRLT